MVESRRESGSDVRPTATLFLLARPGAHNEGVRWDPWRRRFVVSTPARAQRGEANEAIRTVVARALGVVPSDVELVHGARSSEKALRIHGLTTEEATARLRESATGDR